MPLEVISDPREEQIEKLESELASRNRELEAELQDARAMQMGLMPERSPDIKGLKIAGECVTANTVGGDFFSYLPGNANHQIGLVVADVAGHAMKGAMNAVMTDGILHSVVGARTQGSSLPHPGDILTGVNDILASRMESDMNVTMVIALLDTQAMTMTLANAAHHAHPLLVRDGEVQPLRGRGLPLGMRAGVQYREQNGCAWDHSS